jgi:molybdate transport system substrate-binding protein
MQSHRLAARVGPNRKDKLRSKSTLAKEDVPPEAAPAGESGDAGKPMRTRQWDFSKDGKMIKHLKYLLLVAAFLFSTSTRADQITIAAAADLKFAMDEIVKAFNQEHTGDQVQVVYGSSGKFHTQIQEGAPYDLFFSADINFPRKLAESGLASSEVKPYATGRIVLWSATMDASKMTLASLTDPKIARVAIANPKHAPYGKRAEEALRASGLWEKVEPKLVFGENIAHTAQFVMTGNAQAGIIALSLALNPELAGKGGYALIPDDLHEPLEQGFIITKRAAESALARRFADHMSSPAARNVMTKHGFIIPDEKLER